MIRLIVCLIFLGFCGDLIQPASAQTVSGRWVGSWEATPVIALAGSDYGNLTVRQTVHTTIGGYAVRLRISNAYGTAPLVVGAAHVAVPTGADTINPASDVALTFGGLASVTISPGAVAVSDGASFKAAANTNYAVSIYMPSSTGPGTWRVYSSHTAYLAFNNQAVAASMASEFPLSGVSFICGLDVATVGPNTTGIVTVGDSITDGYGSVPGTDTSWPDYLSIALAAQGKPAGVMNAGSSSGKLLSDVAVNNNPSGLARFDRDVLAMPGATRIVMALGINDLNTGSSPAALLAGYEQIIARAHEKGMLVYGATITPCLFCTNLVQSFETERQAVNNDIRAGIGFDGFIDFDAAIRDPANPAQMLAAYDSGDHLHPGSAGYQVMAKAAAVVLSK